MFLVYFRFNIKFFFNSVPLLSFYPAAIMASGYCRGPSGRAGVRASGRPDVVNAIPATILNGFFSNLIETFIGTISRTSSTFREIGP